MTCDNMGKVINKKRKETDLRGIYVPKDKTFTDTWDNLATHLRIHGSSMSAFVRQAVINAEKIMPMLDMEFKPVTSEPLDMEALRS